MAEVWLALAVMQSVSPAPSDDAILSLVRTVMAEEVRQNANVIPDAPCVAPNLNGEPFDSLRKRRAELETRLARTPQDQHALRARQRLRTLSRQWFQPGSSAGQAPLVAPAEAEALDRAARAAAEQSPRIPYELAIDRSRLSGSVATCRMSDQLPAMKLSAPAFQDGIAFVAADFYCGALCGWGRLYALTPSAEGWTIVGVSKTWIS